MSVETQSGPYSSEPVWAKPTNHPTLRPEDDPFYSAPTGFVDLPNGALIRSREIDVALFAVVPQKVQAWQLLYRTMDLHGTPEVTVTTVLLPVGTEPGERLPLMAYQCPIDGVTSRGFPSYALQRGAKAIGAYAQLDFLFIAESLRRGWAVSIADHEGPNGCFGAPREPGYRALDGVRAALSFGELSLDHTTPIGIFGYSGGGMAAAWTAEMAPSHAPELNIVGAVLGSPIGDPGAVFSQLNGSVHAGLALLGIAGVLRAYPAARRLVDAHLTPAGRRHLARVESMTTFAAVPRFINADIGNWMDISADALFAQPEFTAAFDDMRLGRHVPDCPIFVVQSIPDQVIDVQGVDRQVADYREGGADVTYVRDRLGEHLSLMFIAAPAMFDWLSDRLSGEPTTNGTTTVWSALFSGGFGRGAYGFLASILRSAFGRPHSARRSRF